MNDIKHTIIVALLTSLFVGLICFYTGWTVAGWKAGKALAQEQATSAQLRSSITAQNAQIAMLETENKAAQARIADALAANQQKSRAIDHVIEKHTPATPVTTCTEAMPAVRNILAEIQP